MKDEDQRAVTGRTLGIVLCDMFSLNPASVGKIRIEANAEGMATVTIETVLTRRELPGLAVQLSTYTLVLKESVVTVDGKVQP